MLSEKQRGWFQDILDNIDAIKGHTDHLAARNLDTFQANKLVLDAVERCLSRISEAAKRLGKEIDIDHIAPGPPWKQIGGIGNELRHAYDIVNVAIVWDVVVKDLGPLEKACKKALKQ